MCDFDYHNRISLLAELMAVSPDSNMKRSQRVARKNYQRASKEANSGW